jgi:hypothetical protein
VYEKIVESANSKNAWDILLKSYGSDAKVKWVKLSEWSCMPWEGNMSCRWKVMRKIADYFTRLVTLTNQMKNFGETMDE